eukprot:scaffold1846_cov65-Phaeocystis_antarctica.AAC.4
MLKVGLGLRDTERESRLRWARRRASRLRGAHRELVRERFDRRRAEDQEQSGVAKQASPVEAYPHHHTQAAAAAGRGARTRAVHRRAWRRKGIGALLRLRTLAGELCLVPLS